MDVSTDLDRLDRATLRAWRSANLLAWWAVGVVAYYATAIVLTRTFVQKVAYETVGWQAMAAAVAATAFSAVTAGWIVGSRVYRSPGLVAALVVLVPGGAAGLLLTLASGQVASLPLVVAVGAQVAIAAVTSRAVWRRRPRALRAGGP
ncbi:MAG TPA: hypothetical protein VF129_09940 [Actinomycetota bacterium]